MASERLEKALAAQKKAAEAVRKARNADSAERRKADNKIKILLGAAVLIDKDRNGSELYEKLVNMLDPKDQKIIREKAAIYDTRTTVKKETIQTKPTESKSTEGVI